MTIRCLGRRLAAVAIVIVLWLVWEAATWPDVRALASRPPTTTAFIERYKDRERAAGRTPHVEWRWVSAGAIAVPLKRAVLVAEDIDFFNHHGFAPKAMREAMTQALEERRAPRGASTITQQLAKNLWLSPSRSPLRKAREAVMTWQLERALSKPAILEQYLNRAYYGNRATGAQAAAQVECESPELNLGTALETTWLECGRGRWNSTCSGEMRRDVEEHRWRRQPPGPTLTLMHESVGSKQD